MAAVAEKATLAEAMLARAGAPERASAWAEEARAAARARFLGAGAPGRRDEYWKYTDPTRLTADTAEAAALEREEVPVFDEVDALRLVFVDGEFRADLSDDPAMDGVEIQPLSEALSADIHWARDLYGALEANGQDPVKRPLAALNTAVASEGFAIRATGAAPRPVHFRYLHEKSDSDAVVRHLVKVDADASLTILENGPAAARFNKAMEIDIADGASFNHVRAQGRDHERLAATHMFARLGTESAFKSFTLTVNGRLTRNEVVIEFTGDDATGQV